MTHPVGMGVTLAVSTSTGTVTLAKIRSVEGPESATEPVDVTTMDSTGNFRVFVGGGPIDPGEVTLELVYATTNTSFGRLVDYHYNGTQKNYTINFTSTAVQTFAALVQSIGQSIPLDNEITRSVVLKVTKTPGYTT